MPTYSFQMSAGLAGSSVSVSAVGSPTVVASGTLDSNALFTASLPVGDYVAMAAGGHYSYRSAGTVVQSDPDQLADLSSLSAGPVKFRPVRDFYVMGDSISYNGNAGYLFWQPTSYASWAHLLSGSAFRHVGTAASPGWTSAQIRATHLPTVFQARPSACVVLAGTNRQANYPTQEMTDLLAMWDALAGVGTLPIACTVPPQDADADTSAVVKLNAWIIRMARLKGYPVADFFAATVDPATGKWRSGYTSDGTHPTETGAKAMGQVLADLFTRLYPVAGPALLPWANTNTGTSLVTNNLFQTHSGTPDMPSGWNVLNGSGSGFTSAFSTDPGVAGNLWTITRNTADVYVRTAGFTLVPDHKMLLSFKMKASVESVGGGWNLRLRNNTDGTAFIDLNPRAKDVPLSTFAAEFTVPAAVGANYSIEMRANGAVGAAVSIGQPFVVDLTALGIA